MEFDLEFSKRLIEAANSFGDNKTGENQAARAVLYLSLLSCEISLKALLEQAGFTLKELKKRSHDLNGLLEDICSCELLGTEIGNSKPLPASSLLSKVVIPDTANGTVGALLRDKSKGKSKYPNNIRYGDLVKHFPAAVMLKCASTVQTWAQENIKTIKRKNKA
ncbi:MAG: hypothetical protein KQH63_22085 [Desulfobulbaceae bacterium]|nr:hypothetical protein [Desulfobulbaceae bacterium]